MARILWLGDAGCTTGFGTVTHSIGDRLVDQYGHDIHCLGVNYQGDHWPTSLKLYVPTLLDRADVYGKSRYVEMLAKVMPDVVVMLNDPYVILRLLFRNKRDEVLALARFAPIIAYMPVDGTNFPTPWQQLPGLVGSLDKWMDERPKPGLVPVVMSKHGWNLFPNAPLVHHGIDISTFRPVSVANPLITTTGAVITSKAEAKRVFGLQEDSILVLRVDRNSHRKNYVDTYRALAPLMKRYDKLHAWFHCQWEGDDVELNQVIQRDMSLASRFHGPAQYNTRIGWATEDLVTLYNAADIFVSTSWGEGFGLTLGEAAATGLPIIAQNVSSIPEVVGPGGILLEPERLMGVASGEDQWLPDVQAFTNAIERLVESPEVRRSLGDAGREHVSRFSWDDAARRFHELINGVVQKTSGETALEAGGVS